MMKHGRTKVAICLTIIAAIALGQSFAAAQSVPPGATGGKSGGPDRRQAIVTPGVTGGKSGGPDQRQAKKVKGKTVKG